MSIPAIREHLILQELEGQSLNKHTSHSHFTMRSSKHVGSLGPRA
jgi:hypothetical protein